MAGYPLIEEYLDRFTISLGRRPGSAELRDEIADHLYEAADRLVADGAPAIVVQQDVLDRFGSAETTAALIRASSWKGLDLMINLFRPSYLLVAGIAFWLVVGGFGVYFFTDLLRPWEPTGPVLFLLGSILLGLAILSTGVGLIRLHHLDHRWDTLATVALAAFLISAATAALFAWITWFWALPLAAGLAMAAARLLPTRRPAIATILLAGVVPLGLLVTISLWLLAIVSELERTGLPIAEALPWAVTGEAVWTVWLAALALLVAVGLAAIAQRNWAQVESVVSPGTPVAL